MTNTGGAVDVATEPVRVVGSGEARRLFYIIEGTFSATIDLEFAYSPDGPWNYSGLQWNSPQNASYLDAQDGQIIYSVRAGIPILLEDKGIPADQIPGDQKNED